MASQEYLAKYLSKSKDPSKRKKVVKSSISIIDEEELSTTHCKRSEESVIERVYQNKRGRKDEEELLLLQQRQRHDSDSENEKDEGRAKRIETIGDTVYRDKSGRKITIQDHEQEQENKKRRIQEQIRQEKEWRMGRVQREEQQNWREQMSSSTFARHADDKKRNEELQQQTRWGDPLATFVKKPSEPGDRPQYNGAWTPNRYSIRPGFRWDGIDRSNGYEAKVFLKQNERASMAQTAYKWSSEDM